MCGIFGALDFQSEFDPSAHSDVLLKSMRHRGPDSCGVWVDPDVAITLGHTRLAILDPTPVGHQPMVSHRGDYVVSFNGEIYNHLELRTQLAHTAWRGHSDTETLLASVEQWGLPETIPRLVGMFALALWDRRQRVLTLVRDRFGEKPLYYGWQGNTFLFGSELKVLKAHPAFQGTLDRDALALYLRYGYIPTPHTIYQGIYKLPPATYLQVSAQDPSPTPVAYWTLEQVVRQGQQTPFEGSDAAALVALEACLSKAIAGQQLADVPLGAFLSGGIDSSLIVALMMQQSSRPVNTFTIGFSEATYNEAIYAKAVAQHLGSHHTELYVTPQDAQGVIPQLPTLYDEPFADASQVPTFLVSQLARRHVTVSLSGDGGDEVFGGYNRYRWLRKILGWPQPLRQLLAFGLQRLSPQQWQQVYQRCQPMLPRQLAVTLPGDRAHKLASALELSGSLAIYQNLVMSWPPTIPLVIGAAEQSTLPQTWQRFDHLPDIEHQMMAVDTLTYLPDDILCKVDRAAMGVSLETRAPFLDHRVVEFAWRLPLSLKIRHGQTKWLLRQLLYKYVPQSLLERPKMGFSIPIDHWLRGALKDWAWTYLNPTRLQQDGYLNPAPITQRWQEHQAGQRNWQYSLWHVLMFQAWLDENR